MSTQGAHSRALALALCRAFPTATTDTPLHHKHPVVCARPLQTKTAKEDSLFRKHKLRIRHTRLWQWKRLLLPRPNPPYLHTHVHARPPACSSSWHLPSPIFSAPQVTERESHTMAKAAHATLHVYSAPSCYTPSTSPPSIAPLLSLSCLSMALELATRKRTCPKTARAPHPTQAPLHHAGTVPDAPTPNARRATQARNPLLPLHVLLKLPPRSLPLACFLKRRWTGGPPPPPWGPGRQQG